EADLFDQVILGYLLQRLAPLPRDARISLICIGELPGIKRFVGLGQLTPGELATLLPTRQPVTRRQFSLARQCWRALTYRRPNLLNRVATMRTKALPFLPGAIRRYLAEYPSTTNGLSQTEQ